MEPETVFSIFAAEAAHAVAVGSDAAVKTNSPDFEDSEEMALYDSPSSDFQDQEIEDEGDFELDLSDIDDFDQEMVLGATITEDLSEIDEGDLEDSAMGLKEIEVEGLGFNSEGVSQDLEQDIDSKEETEEAVLDEPDAPHSTELEEHESSVELEESDALPESEEDRASDETGISLETDLDLDDLEDENTPESESGLDLAVDLDDGEFELDPDLKLDDLDLALGEENEAIDAATEDQPELTIEDLELEMEDLEDETPSTDSEDDPEKDR